MRNIWLVIERIMKKISLSLIYCSVSVTKISK